MEPACRQGVRFRPPLTIGGQEATAHAIARSGDESKRTRAWTPSGRDDRPVTLSASTALPYVHQERATAGLRAELRHQLGPDNSSTTQVVGPDQEPDRSGRPWFTYTATVETR